jgi:hypothetical protein
MIAVVQGSDNIHVFVTFYFYVDSLISLFEILDIESLKI